MAKVVIVTYGSTLTSPQVRGERLVIWRTFDWLGVRCRDGRKSVGCPDPTVGSEQTDPAFLTCAHLDSELSSPVDVRGPVFAAKGRARRSDCRGKQELGRSDGYHVSVRSSKGRYRPLPTRILAQFAANVGPELLHHDGDTIVFWGSLYTGGVGQSSITLGMVADSAGETPRRLRWSPIQLF